MLEAKFYINPNPDFPNMPCFSFINKFENEKFWMLSELSFCDTDYILDDIIPNIEKIRNGDMYWDPYQSPHYGYFDYYSFGYDATIIDFYKDKSIINYGYGEGKFEVPSKEIYQFMREWGKYLKQWRDNQTNN